MRNPLKWDRYDYNPQALSRKEEKELRREYSRLRKIANKRLIRLGQSPEYRESKAYQYNKKGFKPLEDIKTKGELARALSSLAKLVSSRQSSITGLKEIEKQSIESLHRHGYTFVTRANFRQFMAFMEAWRNYKYDRLYDSERAVQLFQESARLQINRDEILDNFEYWMENQQYLENLPKRIKTVSGETRSERYRELIEEAKKRNGAKHK